MKKISEQKCFGGVQGVYEHESEICGCTMNFGVFTPPQAKDGPVPVLTYLAGLTCTPDNFIVKAGAQRVAAELAKRNIAQIDSPVSGGVAGAEKGTLAVMVSGPRADCELVKPALEVIGKYFYIGDRAGADALAVVRVHQIGEATPEAGRREDDHVGPDDHVLERDLHLGDAALPHRRLAPDEPQPPRLVADREESADALLDAVLVEHPGEDEMEPRYAATGDPVLGAVDNIDVSPPLRAGGQTGRVGAGLGFGQQQARDFRSARHRF